MRLFLAAAVLALTAPGTAAAAGLSLASRDLHGGTAIPVKRFVLVGIHWRGSGAVLFRTRAAQGRWGRWHRAAPDEDDLPDRGTEGRLRGWRFGSPFWTGGADAVQYRTVGRVKAVRAFFVRGSTGEPRAPLRRPQVAERPEIVTRAEWNAPESIRRAPPRYADNAPLAIVHHTVGSNSYSASQSAAIVRSIMIYHVQGNGWNDIGYNFLVDKYGQIFEGRYGGVDKAVVGAHSLGFNTGSFGVAMIGSYGSAKPPAPAVASLEQVLAWKLDLAHVDPLSTLTWKSGGNPRFANGVPVFLRAISGHRDTGFTDCPGNALYALLPQIAKDVSTLGGPKIYAPLAVRNGEGQVRFTARVSAAQPWTVTIVNAAGTQIAQGSGSGASVDWTWDGSTAPSDRYTWTIAATGARSATGSLGSTAALALPKAAATPSAIAPTETTTIAYTLTAAAAVTATLVDPNGQPLATLLTAQKSAGAQTLAFTPPPGLLNGRYAIAITAAAGSRTVATSVPFIVDDIFGALSATPTSATFTLTRAPLGVTLEVRRGTTVVAAPTPVPTFGQQAFTWPALKDGAYDVVLTVTDDIGALTRSVPLVVDTTAPMVTVLSYKNLRFRVGEAATLTLTVGGHTFRRVVKKPATTQFWLKPKPSRYVLRAKDAAGNVTAVRFRG